MRIPRYLSNTSIQLFYSDRMEFYLKYLADERPPRFKQTQPMSVGSAFDAFVKNYILLRLVGKDSLPEEFELDVIFTTQVEEQHRVWAREAGEYVFNCYKRSGALADLMFELGKAAEQPRFEFTVERTIDGIPLLGKPDVWFVVDGMQVLIDWKVNGYCSRSSVSPRKGYIKLVDGWDHQKQKPSRNHRAPHKDAQIIMVKGIQINAAIFLEDVDSKWADQTCLYGWLMGAEIGEKFLTGIDQIVGKPNPGGKPWLRIARHRTRVSEGYQRLLWKRIKHVWDTIQSGHIFDDMPKEKSIERQAMLDDYHKAYEGDDPNEKWFREATRDRRGF